MYHIAIVEDDENDRAIISSFLAVVYALLAIGISAVVVKKQSYK